MSDVLTLSIPLLGESYPSKNSEGADSRRDGRKSDAYTRMAKLTQRAAEAAILETGWTKADCPCLFVLTLIVPNRRRRDALNIGTAEANALTEAGVWDDDTLANPTIKQIVVDDGAPARVSIIVQKTYAPLAGTRHIDTVPKPRRPRAARPAPPSTVPPPSKVAETNARVVRPNSRTFNGIDIPPGYALANGELIPLSEARELMKKMR